jgi:sugar O-acyltransferase (sialic acid O-acetyltransferase NeuD family)
VNTLKIIGAGGHGKVVADIAALSGYTEVSFFDQKWPVLTRVGTWDIIAGIDNFQDDGCSFCAIGNNTVRQQLSEQYLGSGAPILAHPQTVIASSAELGAGTLIVAGAIINPFATVGCGVIVNTASSIDHDCQIGDFSHISPGARLAGNVSIGKRTWIGMGALVKEGVVIGDDVIIGAGAVVLKDVAHGQKVVGSSANRIL